MDSPHRPEEVNPLDELSPTLRAAVEGVRNEPVPSAAQEQALRHLEETLPMSMPNRSIWSRPSLALAALAASVALAFGAGFWTHATLSPEKTGDTQLADNSRPTPLPEAPASPAPLDPAKVGGSEDGLRETTTGPVAVEPTSRKTVRDAELPKPDGKPTQTAPPAGPSPQPVILSGLPGTAGTGGGVGSGGLGGQGGPGLGAGPGPVPGGGLAPGYALPGMPAAPPPVNTTTAPALNRDSGLGDGRDEGKKDNQALAAEVDRLVRDQKTLRMTTSEREKVVREVALAWGRLPASERRGEALAKALEDSVQQSLKKLPANEQQAAVAALRAAVAAQAQPGPEGPGSENYNHFVDNPYQAVQKTPLSTFSVSVDTASYANVRRFLLQEGRLPPPDAVRIADMVNYFHYTYPQPQGDAPVAFAMNMTNCPWNTEHQLLRVALAAKKYSAEKMPPRNFTFLLDTSGSMSPENRLPLLIQSLKLLVEQLRAQDRVAIVTYAGSAGLVLDSTPGNQKEKILRALDNLQAGGSTAGGAGIELAYKVAKENFIEKGLNRVILGTDGDFNVGVSSQGDLVRMIEEKRKTGVYLTILGFGYGNLKDANLERMAHHGNGYFAYIDDIKEAKKIFVEQGAALVTVAKDVKLQLEFNPQRVAGYRLIGYENKLLRDEDFNNDAVDAGDMGSGHTVTALYEIIPAGQKVPNVEVDDLKYQTPKTPAEAANTGEFLTVKLRYKDPDKETSKKLEQPLAGAVEKLDKASEDLRFVAAVAEFGLLLRDSPYKGTANFGSVLEFAKSSLTKDEGGHRAEFVTMATKAKELYEAAPKR